MNRLHPILIEKVVQNLKHGFTLRHTAHECEISKCTVAKYRSLYEQKHGPIICMCGKPSVHRGWCWVRFNRSKNRQATVAAFRRASATEKE